jgi:hypothetical protein
LNPVDLSREEPDPYNRTRRSPRTLEQQLFDIYQPLCDASAALESIRSVLSQYRSELASCTQNHHERAYYIERRTRIKAEQEFAKLYAHHETIVGELHKMIEKCRSVYPGTIRSTDEPPDGNDLLCTYEDYEISHSDWDVLEKDIERELLKASEPEDEEVEMTREHRSALGNAMNGIYEIQQAIPENMTEASSRQAHASAAEQERYEHDLNLAELAGSDKRGLKRKLAEI